MELRETFERIIKEWLFTRKDASDLAQKLDEAVNQWVSVKNKKPTPHESVLLFYTKGRKGMYAGRIGGFITQGFYVEKDFYYHDGRIMRSERCWYDYTDRQLQDIDAKTSKNKVTHWMPLPPAPRSNP